MQEAYIMYSFNTTEDLCPESQGGTERETTPWLTASELGKVLALQGHNNIVVMFVTTTTDKTTDMVSTYKGRCKGIQIMLVSNQIIF